MQQRENTLTVRSNLGGDTHDMQQIGLTAHVFDSLEIGARQTEGPIEIKHQGYLLAAPE